MNYFILVLNLKIDEEKLLVTVVIASIVFTSTNILIGQGGALTREEAIEISRNTKLVQSFLENADRYTLEVHYLNKTQSDTGHGIWTIIWYIHPANAVSAFSYDVIHIIDEETGEILEEGAGASR
jgi:hypothetical protein